MPERLEKSSPRGSMAARRVVAMSSDAVISNEEISDEERQERTELLNGLIDMIRPAVQADGGDLMLVSADVESGVIEVMLQGACSSCAVSSSTLQAGINRILRDRLPWVTEVKGGVDSDVDLEISASMGRGGYIPKA
jgi:Fe-S cluster biogenesis protein NfuA